MQNMEDLISKHEVVWFHVGSDESHFLRELMELNIRWVNGTAVTKDDHCSYFMGISASRRVGHINWRIWRATWLSEEQEPENREQFYSDGKVPLRVDYGKYISGEKDFLVKENVVKVVDGFTYPVGGRAIYVE